MCGLERMERSSCDEFSGVDLRAGSSSSALAQWREANVTLSSSSPTKRPKNHEQIKSKLIAAIFLYKSIGVTRASQLHFFLLTFSKEKRTIQIINHI